MKTFEFNQKIKDLVNENGFDDYKIDGMEIIGEFSINQNGELIYETFIKVRVHTYPNFIPLTLNIPRTKSGYTINDFYEYMKYLGE